MAKRRTGRIALFILLGLVAVVLVAVLVGQGQKKGGERVFTEKIERRTIQEIVSASGKVYPQMEVKISSDVSGEIVELYVEEGDSVVAGQLLAKIDPDAFQSQVARGQAGVNSAKAQLANSRAQIESVKAQKEQIKAQLQNAREIHERNEDLLKDGVISEAEYQQSQANMRNLEANYRAAEANIRSAEQQEKASQYSVESSQATLDELRTSLRRTTVYAPVSGIVSLLNVEQGERVVGTIQMAGTEMMRIANLEAMEVRVEVSENDIPRVTMGNEVEIEVDAYLDRKFKGTVTQIANSSMNTGAATASLDQVTNFEVRIEIDPKSYEDLLSKDKPYPFRPGMSAGVDISTNRVDNALSLPIQSVTTREEKEEEGKEKKKKKDEEAEILVVVFAISADTVRMIPVTTGIQDDRYIQILDGLTESDEVVAGPYTAIARKLEDGTEVLVTDEDTFYKEGVNN